MPSPFPGMDPFIESQDWESFHSEFMVEIARALRKTLPKGYFVRAERRVYVDHGDEVSQFKADGVVVHDPDVRTGGATAPNSIVATEVLLNMPEEHRETFLEVRSSDDRSLVTLIELLSPSNKEAGRGLEEYRRKLDHVFQSGAHFVEVDLLRGGRRCSTRQNGGYQVLVSRSRARPRAEAHRWSLRDPMPTVPIPLRSGDPDGTVDLQETFETYYDEANLTEWIDYARPLEPAPSDTDADWIAERLAAWRAA